jgi:hypothetical protein
MLPPVVFGYGECPTNTSTPLAGAFDLVAVITTSKFLSDPLRALVEALRVARRGLIRTN